MAVGQSALCANPQTDETSYLWANGTSFSCPLVAGICAMILQARPELNPMEIHEALIRTASQAASPDTILGYGIADAYEALFYHGMVFTDFSFASSNTTKSSSEEDDDEIQIVGTRSKKNKGGVSSSQPITLDSSQDVSTSRRREKRDKKNKKKSKHSKNDKKMKKKLKRKAKAEERKKRKKALKKKEKESKKSKKKDKKKKKK